MIEQNIKDYENATKCWVCKQEIAPLVQAAKQHNPKVRDHCHFTGEYRGAAHKCYNLKLKIQPSKTKIPVVFHNLRGYDTHLIMQQIHRVKGNITCIPNFTEKYPSFGVGQLKFLDSVQFMLSSLERLVDTTAK